MKYFLIYRDGTNTVHEGDINSAKFRIKLFSENEDLEMIYVPRTQNYISRDWFYHEIAISIGYRDNPVFGGT